MEQILEGGAELILGGGETLKIGITVVAAFVAALLAIYIIKNPPSSLFGQIAYILGTIITVSLALFIGLRGLSIGIL